MDQTEIVAVVITTVNFALLVLNYIAAPVRKIRQKTEDLMLELVVLKQRIAAIELNLGIRRGTD